MTGTYYAAVEGDPLTSGEGSCVYSKKNVGTIADDSGRPRRMAFIGDDAYCPKCKSTGFISYGAGVNERRRMVDLVNGGRLQAVGGDIVLCMCADPPRIIAMYGRKWTIHDRGEEKAASIAKAPAQSPTYDEQYTLIDSQGRPLAGVRYRVRVGAQLVLSGVSDAGGKTQRIRTDGSQRLTLEVAH